MLSSEFRYVTSYCMRIHIYTLILCYCAVGLYYAICTVLCWIICLLYSVECTKVLYSIPPCRMLYTVKNKYEYEFIYIYIHIYIYIERERQTRENLRQSVLHSPSNILCVLISLYTVHIYIYTHGNLCIHGTSYLFCWHLHI